MLTDKKHQNTHSSQYRISVAKPLIHSKNVSIRSVSVAHTATNKKEHSPIQNQSIIANKTLTVERYYSSTDKQYYVHHLPTQFYLGRGNNEDLVRRVLRTRGSWIQKQDSTNAFINFKWQQDQKGYKYTRLVDSGIYRCVLDQLQFH